MTMRHTFIASFSLLLLAACGQDGGVPPTTDSGDTTADSGNTAAGEPVEIVAGLTMKKLKNGYGRIAEAGDRAEVHYTGWLHDAEAADGRGEKFDSSVDRGQRFTFPLGAGAVIKGWDQGVAGMLIGEKRELTIAPELAYGDRGAGGVIPPGATLVFEIELFGLQGPDDAASE